MCRIDPGASAERGFKRDPQGQVYETRCAVSREDRQVPGRLLGFHGIFAWLATVMSTVLGVPLLCPAGGPELCAHSVESSCQLYEVVIQCSPFSGVRLREGKRLVHVTQLVSSDHRALLILT